MVIKALRSVVSLRVENRRDCSSSGTVEECQEAPLSLMLPDLGEAELLC